MMEQPLDVRLTPSLAREVCQRTGATIEVEGSIATLGNQYVLGLNAVRCATGDVVARAQVTADSKEHVLPALGAAASELRSKLGESRASLKTYDVPLDQATTSSLEALQAYSQGVQTSWKGNLLSAISSFQRAVELDPNFATAYAWMGISYGNTGNNDLAAKTLKRAYELKDRTSQYEKLGIAANYNLFVTRDLEKAVQVFEQLTNTYPRRPDAWVGLGVNYDSLGRYDQSLAAFTEAGRLNPSALSYGSVALSYMRAESFPRSAGDDSAGSRQAHRALRGVHDLIPLGLSSERSRGNGRTIDAPMDGCATRNQGRPSRRHGCVPRSPFPGSRLDPARRRVGHVRPAQRRRRRFQGRIRVAGGPLRESSGSPGECEGSDQVVSGPGRAGRRGAGARALR